MIRSHNIKQMAAFFYTLLVNYICWQSGSPVPVCDTRLVWGHKSQINIIMGHARALGR